MSRRDEDLRAIADSTGEEPEARPRRLGPGPLEDACATCRAPLLVHDRAWRWMRSVEGLVVGSNYCGLDCEAEGWLWPDLIATEMRSRPGYGEPER